MLFWAIDVTAGARWEWVEAEPIVSEGAGPSQRVPVNFLR